MYRDENGLLRGRREPVKVGISCGPGKTRQSMKDECDINVIMRKYTKTGIIDFVNNREPQFGDATGIDFQVAMDTVQEAQTMFGEMPASVRKKFNNDPALFLDFVSDPNNLDELYELGLAVKPKEEVPAQTPEEVAANPAPSA